MSKNAIAEFDPQADGAGRQGWAEGASSLLGGLGLRVWGLVFRVQGYLEVHGTY